MKVGDRVIPGKVTEIASIAYDENGEKIYGLKDNLLEFNEKDLYSVEDLMAENEELKQALCETVVKAGELYAGFFMHIRQTLVEPKGKELGKTDKEISQMTIDSINVYLNEKLDMVAAKKYIDEVEDDCDINITDETFEKFTKTADEVLNDEGDHIPSIE